MAVVDVVVVVVEQLLYMGPLRAHVWSSKIQKKNPFFYFKAHVWIKCPCMVNLRSKRGGGVPLHSEFIARKKVVGINYLWITLSFRTMISD